MRCKVINDYDESSEFEIEASRFLWPGTFEALLVSLGSRPEADKTLYLRRLDELLSSRRNPSVDDAMLDEYLRNFPGLSACKALGRAFLRRRLELTGIQACPAPADKLRLRAINYLRGVFTTEYYVAKAIAAIMPETAALQYYKDFTDERIRTVYRLPHYEKVSDFLTMNNPSSGVFEGGFNCIECELDSGRAGCKITKCKWHEAVKEINDPAFEYAVICHYDFEAARLRNPDFELTRKGTLAQGRPYCDFIWHDKRLDKTLSHPPAEFWGKLDAIAG